MSKLFNFRSDVFKAYIGVPYTDKATLASKISNSVVGWSSKPIDKEGVLLATGITLKESLTKIGGKTYKINDVLVSEIPENKGYSVKFLLGEQLADFSEVFNCQTAQVAVESATVAPF